VITRDWTTRICHKFEGEKCLSLTDHSNLSIIDNAIKFCFDTVTRVCVAMDIILDKWTYLFAFNVGFGIVHYHFMSW
jgi:hypothetical protein